MGNMSSSLNVRNMNWSMERRRQEQQDLLDIIATKRARNEQSTENAKLIRDLMTTQEEYNAWWSSTPDDAQGWYDATVAKLAELQLKHISLP